MKLPPLPHRSSWERSYESGTTFDLFTEKQMREYAAAAIEAYKASLKPVAWIMAPHGVLRYDTDFGLKGPQSLDWRLPLYLLDDSQKDDQP